MRISDWSSDVCSSDLANRDRCASSPVCASISVIASPRVGPDLRRWVLSSVSATESGTPIRAAARAAPVASGMLLKVIAQAKSTRSEEHTSELRSLMRISYAVFCLKQKQIQIAKEKHKQ